MPARSGRHGPGTVSFALQGEDRVGAGLDPIVDRAGQVDSEKRQSGQAGHLRLKIA